MDKPDVDRIEGLSPAVSIDQKSTTRNPRSTVATVTEIYDHMRLLLARIGKPHCPERGRPIVQQTAQQIVDQMLEHAGRHAGPDPRPRGARAQRRISPDLRRHPPPGLRRACGWTAPFTRWTKRSTSSWPVTSSTTSTSSWTARGQAEARKRLADSMELALHVGKGVAAVQVVEARR